jgi:hypothetical protein
VGEQEVRGGSTPGRAPLARSQGYSSILATKKRIQLDTYVLLACRVFIDFSCRDLDSGKVSSRRRFSCRFQTLCTIKLYKSIPPSSIKQAQIYPLGSAVIAGLLLAISCFWKTKKNENFNSMRVIL